MTTLEQLLGHDQTANPIDDYLSTITDAIRNQPRSLQKIIGPSELGTDCTHCLAAKLAGWAEQERDIPWLPFIGTAVHAELARIFETASQTAVKTGGRGRWLVEQRVYVGMIGPHPITGSCDLYDQATGTVLDHKIVGAETLRTAKAGVKEVYRVQAHLYGLGWENAGHTPERVAIAHLPRNAVSLTQDVIHVEDYDPAIARAALERANRVHANVTALASISETARDEWITALDRAPGCFSCRRYPDWATQPSRLATELGITTASRTTRKAA
ncbi:hypothetical protein Bra3105_17860 [Brachybacterium halotolerans subsp. kimchii]|uniref:hypothetical protein n=1 Tax=Brachybacterium halotolerans TaxID=2795215 RepID=UPI001E63DF87|nr:hypothetical protein [Brachybacterium halotolerans]UEJ82668.1 hypothetical protein Bra3105_17860 [Brachybacterium halotolerans subsp. kimchii]